MKDDAERAREVPGILPQDWDFWLKGAAQILQSNGTETHAEKVRQVREAIEAMIALAEPPKGWVLVPRELTDEMMYVWGSNSRDHYDHGIAGYWARQTWSAMLDAAPIPGEE